MNIQHLYLLAPLHTGGTTQEGNLLGIARESHTNFPYIPSSTIRGRLRAEVDDSQRDALFGTDLSSGDLIQGSIWLGDGSLLWLPVPSLSHGVIWISCPLLLNRYARVANIQPQTAIAPYLCNFHQANEKIYLKDAIFEPSDLTQWQHWQQFIPTQSNVMIERVLVLPDQHCATVIQMGLWRQVKIKLDEHKSVKDGSFRYEEAIPPDTLMYFPWGITAQAKGDQEAGEHFKDLLTSNSIIQIGGQESLGRGFVECF